MNQFKYQTIADKISARIDTGQYPQGSKLPTHRVLAEQLETTAVTVAKAYKLLVERRIIESFVGRGSYVLSHQLKSAISVRQNTHELNFSILQPCLKQSVFELQQVFRERLTPFNPQLLAYTENSRMQEHRLAGAKWCAHFGLNVTSSDEIILTNGAQNALASLIQLYSKEGDCIAVEAFTYPAILSICKYMHRRVVAIEMDQQGMLPEALLSQSRMEKPALVIVVPAQQNPTGATMSNSRRAAIAKVIVEEVLWLIEDDIYAFLNQEALRPISNLIPQRCFYISSLSKAISPGMRCGYLKCPPNQVERVQDYMRATLWLPSPFMFDVASSLVDSEKAFSAAALQKIKASMRQRLVTKFLVRRAIDRQLTSYSCWLHLPVGCSSEYFTDAAFKQGVLVSDASYFSVAKSINAVRLSVMAIEDDALFIKGLQKIERLLCDIESI